MRKMEAASSGSSNTLKRRHYSEDYLKYGFILFEKGQVNKPQCIICGTLLSENSMKPSLLKRHFVTNHASVKDKDID